MTSTYRTICGVLAVWILVSAFIGAGLLVPQPKTEAAFPALKPTDQLIGPPRGTAAGVIRLAVALGSYRLADVKDYVNEIYRLAPIVGLDPAILIGQSALETGYWKGKFWISSLNPAGIGIYDDNQPHSFYWASGANAARGHIYHLYTYARGVPPANHILHQYRAFTPGVQGAVRLGYAGTRHTIESLEGSWALMSLYALGLCNKGNEIMRFGEWSEPTATPTATAIANSGLTASTTASAGNQPERTQDGYRSTSWAILGNGSIPASGYITYDLGGPVQLSSINWQFRKTGFADYLSIRGSLDGITWTTLKVVGNAPDTKWQSLATTASARYVRFYFRNPNGDPDLGYLAEVRINGFAIPGPTATATLIPTYAVITGKHLIPIGSGGSGNASPSKLIRDGSFDTNWRTLASPAPIQASVYLDMGGTATITGVRWYLHTASCGSEFAIELSNDKKSWIEVARAGTERAGKWFAAGISASARYIRFRFVNDGQAAVLGCLSEAQVWGTGITPETPTATPALTATPTTTATATGTPTATTMPTMTASAIWTATAIPASPTEIAPTGTATDAVATDTPVNSAVPDTETPLVATANPPVTAEAP